jgi:predicted RNase H-like HicB family nuclease
MLDLRAYRLVVTPSRTGFAAHTPDIDGVRVHADTVEECVCLMRTAIAVELELAQLHGEALAAPSGPGVEIGSRGRGPRGPPDFTAADLRPARLLARR